MKSRNPFVMILGAWMALAFANSASSAAEATGETVKLTPFEVSTSKDRGYAAGNTLSGGRVDTPLEITPGSISVMTKEFMDDFNITNINDAGAWTIGFDLGTPVGSSNPSSISTYQVMFRGAPSDQNFPTRNGSINFGVADSYNTERFEFQRGPDTSMFGDGGPGGRQSSSSKRARFNTTATSLSTQVDTYGGYRGTLDYNKGWDRLALRFNALGQNNKFYTDETNRIKKAWTLNTVTKLTKNTHVIAEYERVSERNQLWSATIGDSHILWDGVTVNDNNQAIAANNSTALANLGIQLVAANATTDYFTWDFGTGTFENFVGNQYRTRPVAGVYRIPWPGNPNLPPTRTPALKGIDKRFNLHAKSNVADRDADTFSIALEHRVGDLFVKLSFDQNHYDNITPYSNTSPNDYILDLNRLLPDGRLNPMFLRGFVDVVQNRIYNEDRKREFAGLATYRFSRPAWWDYKQQLSLSTSYRETHNESFTDAWRRVADRSGAPVDPFAANSANQVRYRVYWGEPRPDIADIFTNPNKYFGSAGKWAVVQEAGNLTDRTVKGVGLISQSAFLNEKIALTGSVRRDDVGVDTMNRLSGAAGYNPVTFKNVVGTNGVAGAHFKRNEVVTSASYGLVTYPFRDREAAGSSIRKAISPLGFVFNRAENTQPPNGSANFPLIDGTPAPLTKAKTTDFGLRYSIPGGRAYLTVTHYNTDSKDIPNTFGSATDIRNIWTNLGYTDPLLVGGNSFQYTDPAARKLEGWEIELTANPTRQITLTANYAHQLTYIETDSDVRKAYVAAHRAEWETGARATTGAVLNGHSIVDPVAIQTALTNIDNSLNGLTTGTLEDGTFAANYRHRMTFSGRYAFTEGKLKGLALVYQANYKRHVKTGSVDPRIKFRLPESANPTGEQIRAAAFDYLWAPPTLVQNAGIIYTRRFGRQNWRFQLNVANLTNNDHPIWGRNGASGAYTTVAANAYLNGNPRMQIMNNFTQYDPRKFTFSTTVSF